MKDSQISERLSRIDDEEWKSVIKKCYGHIRLKVGGRTKVGAHCQQRLGSSAEDFYFEKACIAIFEGTWTWDYERFEIAAQLIRIINSMISEEVRKYKVEVEKKRSTVLMEDRQLSLLIEEGPVEEYDESYLQKLNKALEQACEGNEEYKQFVELRKKGVDYHNIAQQMNCSINYAYQMMETISRRARRILKNL